MIKDVVSKKLFKKNTLNLDDESLILSMLGIKSFNKVLFIGINKKSLIESYIVKNQYKYLNIFDPSTSKLNVYSNVYLNSFFPRLEVTLSNITLKVNTIQMLLFLKKI